MSDFGIDTGEVEEARMSHGTDSADEESMQAQRDEEEQEQEQEQEEEQREEEQQEEHDEEQQQVLQADASRGDEADGYVSGSSAPPRPARAHSVERELEEEEEGEGEEEEERAGAEAEAGSDDGRVTHQQLPAEDAAGDSSRDSFVFAEEELPEATGTSTHARGGSQADAAPEAAASGYAQGHMSDASAAEGEDDDADDRQLRAYAEADPHAHDRELDEFAEAEAPAQEQESDARASDQLQTRPTASSSHSTPLTPTDADDPFDELNSTAQLGAPKHDAEPAWSIEDGPVHSRHNSMAMQQQRQAQHSHAAEAAESDSPAHAEPPSGSSPPPSHAAPTSALPSASASASVSSSGTPSPSPEPVPQGHSRSISSASSDGEPMLPSPSPDSKRESRRSSSPQREQRDAAHSREASHEFLHRSHATLEPVAGSSHVSQGAPLSLRQASSRAVEQQLSDSEEPDARTQHERDAPVDVDQDDEDEEDELQSGPRGLSTLDFALVGTRDLQAAVEATRPAAYAETPAKQMSGSDGAELQMTAGPIYRGRRHEIDLSLALSEHGTPLQSPHSQRLHSSSGSSGRDMGLIQASLAASGGATQGLGGSWQRLGPSGSPVPAHLSTGPSPHFLPTLSPGSGDLDAASLFPYHNLRHAVSSSTSERLVALLIEKDNEIYERSRRMRELALQDSRKHTDMIALSTALEASKQEYNAMLQHARQLAEAYNGVAPHMHRLENMHSRHRTSTLSTGYPLNPLDARRAHPQSRQGADQNQPVEHAQPGEAQTSALVPSSDSLDPRAPRSLSSSSASSSIGTSLRSNPAMSPRSQGSISLEAAEEEQEEEEQRTEESPQPFDSSATPLPSQHVPQPQRKPEPVAKTVSPQQAYSARELRELGGVVSSTPACVPPLRMPVVSLPMSAPPTSRAGAREEPHSSRRAEVQSSGAGTFRSIREKSHSSSPPIWADDSDSSEEESESEAALSSRPSTHRSGATAHRRASRTEEEEEDSSDRDGFDDEALGEEQQSQQSKQKAQAAQLPEPAVDPHSSMSAALNARPSAAEGYPPPPPPVKPASPAGLPIWPGAGRRAADSQTPPSDAPLYTPRSYANYVHQRVPPPTVAAHEAAADTQGTHVHASLEQNPAHSPRQQRQPDGARVAREHAQREHTHSLIRQQWEEQSRGQQRSSAVASSASNHPSLPSPRAVQQQRDAAAVPRPHEGQPAGTHRMSGMSRAPSSSQRASQPQREAPEVHKETRSSSSLSASSLSTDVPTLQAELLASRHELDRARALVVRLKQDRVKLKQKVDTLKHKLERARSSKENGAAPPAPSHVINAVAHAPLSKPAPSAPASGALHQQFIVEQLANDMQHLREHFEQQAAQWTLQRQSMEHEIHRLSELHIAAQLSGRSPSEPPHHASSEEDAKFPTYPPHSQRSAPSQQARGSSRSRSPILHELPNDNAEDGDPSRGDAAYLASLSRAHARAHQNASADFAAAAARAPSSRRARSASGARTLYHDVGPRIKGSELNKHIQQAASGIDERAEREHRRREEERQRKLQEKRLESAAAAAAHHAEERKMLQQRNQQLQAQLLQYQHLLQQPPSSIPTLAPSGVSGDLSPAPALVAPTSHRLPQSTSGAAWEREVQWQMARAADARRHAKEADEKRAVAGGTEANGAIHRHSSPTSRGKHLFIREAVREQEREKLFARRYGEA